MDPQDNVQPLVEIETLYRSRLPDSFRNLYLRYRSPYIAPCEFFTASEILAGKARTFGMLPQFLPFGRSVGETGLYGFYLTPSTRAGYWPVVYLDEEEMFYRPVGSDFEAFLRHCILHARYETEDAQDDEPGAGVGPELKEIAATLLLDESLLFGPLPRNEAELHIRIIQSDPMCASSLCHLGCIQRSRQDMDRALDFFHRAIEAAPWFGDSHYLLADSYRELGRYERAVEGWWTVMHQLLPFCTRTWEWNLGSDYPEADIFEIAADALRQFGDHAPTGMRASELWRIATSEDPYDPDLREGYAADLLLGGDLSGAEREYLNALSLCCNEKSRQPDRIYAALQALYERLGRETDLAICRQDSMRPRNRK